MRAKFVPAGNRDVGSTVTRITPFHGGNDFAGTLERRVRGETWPKVTMLFFKTSFHVQMGTRIVARALPRFVYVVCTRDEEPFAPVVVGGRVTCAHLPHARRFTCTTTRSYIAAIALN